MKVMPEKIIATVCMLLRKSESVQEILLGYKTKKFCKFRWVLNGGQWETDESLKRCAQRELFEETGIRAEPEDLEKRAVIVFHNQREGGTPVIIEVHVYVCMKWSGKPEEKDPGLICHTWFPIEGLPEKIPFADKEWIPMVAAGKHIAGEVWYADGNVDVCIGDPIWEEVVMFVENDANTR